MPLQTATYPPPGPPALGSPRWHHAEVRKHRGRLPATAESLTASIAWDVSWADWHAQQAITQGAPTAAVSCCFCWLGTSGRYNFIFLAS